MTTAYRPQASSSRTPTNPADDYERWYTEASHANRMLLALRSGIEGEMGWALDRLGRLCNNEQFALRAIPGLTDALFEWPYWYVRGGAYECARDALFALAPVLESARRHALDSLFVLRNAAMASEPNTMALKDHPRTRDLILLGLHMLRPDSDANTEFVHYIIDLLHAIGAGLALPPPGSPFLSNPIPPLQEIAGTSPNRALIVAALSTLALVLSNPANVSHLTEDSLALEGALKVLPLFADKALVDAAVNYLYTHLSHPPMSKAFLLHPRMPHTLKLLVSLLLSEQVEETVSIGIGGPVFTGAAIFTETKPHELTQEELHRLLLHQEPQRCYEWMQTMFVADPAGEMTQVQFWHLYESTFKPYSEHQAALPASDVIKNVSVAFPQAQAMVLPGPPQKFVIRGVDRRKDVVPLRDFACRWDRSQCAAGSFGSTTELYEHILQEHIDAHEEAELPCTWSTCPHGAPMPKRHLQGHVLVHLPSPQDPAKDPAQPETVTLPSEGFPNPVPDPTARPPPPPRAASVSYTRPVMDPPSAALTALLCVRILFRAAFASSDAAPRVDEDHFGFPGVVEEPGEREGMVELDGTDKEREGERRGRKAFVGIRHLLEDVRLKDDALMGWITEMIDAGLTGTT